MPLALGKVIQLTRASFLRSKTPGVTHQRGDFATLQLLAESGHAASSASDDADQRARARDVCVLAPPLGVRQVGRFVQLARWCLRATVGSVTSRAVVPEQFGDVSSASGFGGMSLSGRCSYGYGN